MSLPSKSRWKGTTWETVLLAFTHSTVSWVSDTATEWLDYLVAALPRVGPDTYWDGTNDASIFRIAMRARSAWIFNHLETPPPMEAQFLQSGAGVSWVVKLTAPSIVTGYLVAFEMEERLAVYDWKKIDIDKSIKIKGPSVKVSLEQLNVSSSSNFDWDLLLRLWRVMEQRGDIEWAQASARPKAAHDRDGWASIVEQGAPPFLGTGFGDAQAGKSGSCLFGARFQLKPDITLSELLNTLQGLFPLLHSLSEVA